VGKFFEEFVVGEVTTSPGRTVTETDLVAFSWVSGDANQMHTDAVHAAASPLGQRVAHGMLGMSICTGLSARIGHMEGTAIAQLAVEDWRFLKPLFIGDTVTLRTTVMETVPSRKGGRGVIKRRMELLNQRGEVVQAGVTSVMVRARDQGAEE
jgi:acyl dehydratase